MTDITLELKVSRSLQGYRRDKQDSLNWSEDRFLDNTSKAREVVCV